MGSLAQKTKIWWHNALSRRFGKYSFEFLQTTWKNKTKTIKMLDLVVKNWKLRVWCSLFHFFHVIWKISNFNMHLAQASCTELTLKRLQCSVYYIVCNLYNCIIYVPIYIQCKTLISNEWRYFWNILQYLNWHSEKLIDYILE